MDTTAGAPRAPAPYSVVEIEDLEPWTEAKPGQECWCQQRRVSATGTIDLDEISRPEILDPGELQRGHLRDHVLCLFQ